MFRVFRVLGLGPRLQILPLRLKAFGFRGFRLQLMLSGLGFWGSGIYN